MELGATMTLPDERYRAVLAAEQFMKDLMDPRRTPRVPRTVREQARSVLRHYPTRFDLDSAAQAAPHTFARHMDPLYKMVKRWEQTQQQRSAVYGDSEGGDTD